MRGSLSFWALPILILMVFTMSIIAIIMFASATSSDISLSGVFTETIDEDTRFTSDSASAFMLAQSVIRTSHDGEPLYKQLRTYMRCTMPDVSYDDCSDIPDEEAMIETINDSMTRYLSDQFAGERPFYVDISRDGTQLMELRRDVDINVEKVDRYRGSMTRVVLPIALPGEHRGHIEFYIRKGGMSVLAQ